MSTRCCGALPTRCGVAVGAFSRGNIPRPLTRKEILAFSPLVGAYFHASHEVMVSEALTGNRRA